MTQSATEFHSTRTGHRARWRFTLIIAAAVAVIAGCGDSDGGDPEFQRVIATDTVLEIGQFEAAGLKRSKEYDVADLPQAVSAFYGFWTPVGDQSVDFELRFYPSHEVAVADGTALAEEVSGPDGVVTESESTWKVGIRDRRTSGFTAGGGGGSLAVKYGDFMIYGNVILLCQGRDSEQSLARCDKLVKAVMGG